MKKLLNPKIIKVFIATFFCIFFWIFISKYYTVWNNPYINIALIIYVFIYFLFYLYFIRVGEPPNISDDKINPLILRSYVDFLLASMLFPCIYFVPEILQLLNSRISISTSLWIIAQSLYFALVTIVVTISIINNIVGVRWWYYPLLLLGVTLIGGLTISSFGIITAFSAYFIFVNSFEYYSIKKPGVKKVDVSNSLNHKWNYNKYLILLGNIFIYINLIIFNIAINKYPYLYKIFMSFAASGSKGLINNDLFNLFFTGLFKIMLSAILLIITIGLLPKFDKNSIFFISKK